MFGLLFLNAKVRNFAVLFCPRQCLCFLANFWLFRENCSSDGLLLVALTTLPADKARLGLWKETARCSYALKHENDPGVVVVSAQSCLTLCSPMACSPPGSFVHGMSQARMAECVAVSSSWESSWCRDQTSVSCIGRQALYPWATREAHMSEWWLLYHLSSGG